MVKCKCGFIGNEGFFYYISKKGGTNKCKNCKSKSDKKYYSANKEKIFANIRKWNKENPEKSKIYQSRTRFNIKDINKFIKNKSCEKCRMTNDQHFKKFKQRLQIHHKDNRGRSVKLKDTNNNPDNLEILCRSCHCIETNKQSDYLEEVLKYGNLGEGIPKMQKIINKIIKTKLIDWKKVSSGDK